MKTSKLAAIISTLLLGGLTATSAQAVPVASAQSIVAFENFKIFKADGTTQLDAATDFDVLTVNSSQRTTAFVGLASDTDTASSSTGETLAINSSVGVIQPASLNADITGNTAASPTDFKVVSLPITGGNFSATGSNEIGAPILNFEGLAATSASLHNASYASLDGTTGTAGTNSTSKLTAEFTFVPTTDGELVFSFDAGTYLAAYLTAGADQRSNAGFSITFTLVETNGPGDGLFQVNPFINPWVNALGNYVFNNGVTDDAPGDGIVRTRNTNAAVNPDGTLVTTNQIIRTQALTAGVSYNLFAEITTSADVELRTVPEPQSLALLGIGLLGFAASSSRKMRRQSIAA